MNISILTGKTLKAIRKEDDGKVYFDLEDGNSFVMYHSQDCCEHVRLEEVIGDLDDLIGSPILLAEEVSSREPEAEVAAKRAAEKAEAEAKGDYYSDYEESETWTFYKFATIKGSVTLRWYGRSNGYYSEAVDFAEAGKDW